MKIDQNGNRIPIKDSIQSHPVFESTSNKPVTDFIFLLENIFRILPEVKKKAAFIRE